MPIFFQELEQKEIPFRVIHLGDEFQQGDISFYSMKMCKAVIRNYQRPDITHLPHVHVIPLGYHHTFEKESDKPFHERELMWSFHGTGWHDRGEQLQAFASFVPHSCHLQSEWNSSQATKEKQYTNTMCQSKFCPILRGNNAETFRFYEALEAGCIPVTTITDPTYLAWIEKNMGLSSLYPWTNPVEVMCNIDGTEQMALRQEALRQEALRQEALRQEVGKRWTIWKTNVRTMVNELTCYKK
jgi:hypothetical protein